MYVIEKLFLSIKKFLFKIFILVKGVMVKGRSKTRKMLSVVILQVLNLRFKVFFLSGLGSSETGYVKNSKIVYPFKFRIRSMVVP